jgi:transposase
MHKIVRRHFTDDFKSQALALAQSVGPAAAARKLDMSVKTLSRWVTAARRGLSLSSSKRRGATDLDAEVSRLLAENATLKMERDILKKATAFFAKESR